MDERLQRGSGLKITVEATNQLPEGRPSLIGARSTGQEGLADQVLAKIEESGAARLTVGNVVSPHGIVSTILPDLSTELAQRGVTLEATTSPLGAVTLRKAKKTG